MTSQCRLPVYGQTKTLLPGLNDLSGQHNSTFGEVVLYIPTSIPIAVSCSTAYAKTVHSQRFLHQVCCSYAYVARIAPVHMMLFTPYTLYRSPGLSYGL